MRRERLLWKRAIRGTLNYIHPEKKEQGDQLRKNVQRPPILKLFNGHLQFFNGEVHFQIGYHIQGN